MYNYSHMIKSLDLVMNSHMVLGSNIIYLLQLSYPQCSLKPRFERSITASELPSTVPFSLQFRSYTVSKEVLKILLLASMCNLLCGCFIRVVNYLLEELTALVENLFFFSGKCTNCKSSQHAVPGSAGIKYQYVYA